LLKSAVSDYIDGSCTVADCLSALSWRGRAPFASVPWQTQICHQVIYRLYPSPSNRTLIKLIPRTVQRALINLAIEDAIAGEESSCKKCFP
jgi:hypothetical protein